MKLVTWNVNSLKARMPRVLELLEAHQPDVLMLQETKTEPDAFPHLELEAAGYRAEHHSAGRWAGVAVAVPVDRSLSEARMGLEGEVAADEARWIEVDVEGMRVVSVYVPNGRTPDSPHYEDKLRFLEAAAARIGELSDRELVVAGDFNVCPSDLDVYDPAAFVGETHVTPPERERFAALLEAGTVDAFRELHPDRAGLHLVGLPPGPLPPQDGTAHRCVSAHAAAGRAAGELRHRPRLSQGPQAVGPRTAAVRAGRLTRWRSPRRSK